MRKETDATRPPVEKDTGRIEAFSDGVIAIALTLLVLDLKIPQPPDEGKFDLIGALLQEWPVYLAFVTSFFFVLVIWINHHRLFTVIRRSDNTLLLLNGLLLFGVTILPFATQLVAEYLRRPEQNIVVVIYDGFFVIISIFFNVLWQYASYNNRLFNEKTDYKLVQFISRQYSLGIFLYFVAFGLAFLSAYASLAMNLGMAVFFAMPNKTVETLMDEAEESPQD